jgi:protein TonB
MPLVSGLLYSAEMTSASYYVHKDGVNYGPETAENLRLLGEQGWLQPEDLVWREGEAEWHPAGDVFLDAFSAAPVAEEEPVDDFDPTEGGFFVPAAVHMQVRTSWPWGSIGIAIIGHAALLLVALEWFRMHPIKFTASDIPASQDPPLEVAMIPEAPPPPPPPPDPTPSDPAPAPPEATVPLTPPPLPMPELTPPPAPPIMPVPTLAPLPVTTSELETPAPISPPPVPRPEHRKMARPTAPRIVTAPAPAEPPPAPAEAGQPEYLADPKPTYPYGARQRHQEGTVLLLVTLDADGNPTDVQVEQSSGVAVLDEAARKKVAEDWRFKPGQGSTVHVPVEFHLGE